MIKRQILSLPDKYKIIMGISIIILFFMNNIGTLLTILLVGLSIIRLLYTRNDEPIDMRTDAQKNPIENASHPGNFSSDGYRKPGKWW
jgi:hypothetical protein